MSSREHQDCFRDRGLIYTPRRLCLYKHQTTDTHTCNPSIHEAAATHTHTHIARNRERERERAGPVIPMATRRPTHSLVGSPPGPWLRLPEVRGWSAGSGAEGPAGGGGACAAGCSCPPSLLWCVGMRRMPLLLLVVGVGVWSSQSPGALRRTQTWRRGAARATDDKRQTCIAFMARRPLAVYQCSAPVVEAIKVQLMPAGDREKSRRATEVPSVCCGVCHLVLSLISRLT